MISATMRRQARHKAATVLGLEALLFPGCLSSVSDLILAVLVRVPVAPLSKVTVN
jgi:hypothetical protein